MSGKHDSGKGDTYRKVDQKKWDEGWKKAFSKNKKENKSKNKGFKNGRN